MTELFELWIPRCLTETKYSFDLTAANLPMIGELSKEWLNRRIMTLGIGGSVNSWKIEMLNCNFYSVFPNSLDFHDRWRTTWDVSVCIDSPSRKYRTKFHSLPVPIEERDTTWKFGNFSDEVNDRFLIIWAYLQNQERESKEHARFIFDILHQEKAQNIELVEHLFEDGWKITRVKATIVRIDENLRLLDIILSKIKAAGFVTNWSDVW